MLYLTTSTIMLVDLHVTSFRAKDLARVTEENANTCTVLVSVRAVPYRPNKKYMCGSGYSLTKIRIGR